MGHYKFRAYKRYNNDMIVRDKKKKKKRLKFINVIKTENKNYRISQNEIYYNMPLNET